MFEDKKMKIVINDCYGGFGLSAEARKWLKERGLEYEDQRLIERHNPLLVECVETLGSQKASAKHAWLVVKEIIPNPPYYIYEHDGMERTEGGYGYWLSS